MFFWEILAWSFVNFNAFNCCLIGYSLFYFGRIIFLFKAIYSLKKEEGTGILEDILRMLSPFWSK